MKKKIPIKETIKNYIPFGFLDTLIAYTDIILAITDAVLSNLNNSNL